MMIKSKRKRMMKYMQNQLNRMFAYLLIMNLIIVFMVVFTIIARTSGNNQNEDGKYLTVYESVVAETGNTTENDNHNAVNPSANVLPNNQTATDNEVTNVVEYSKGLHEYDKYLLAKLTMAEAEGESLETKILVICVVLNRVKSNEFPDTVEDVIFQRINGVYQFTPIGSERWANSEPNEDCWKAVEIVNSVDYDFSQGALYFEACSGESWHSRNLEFICQSDNTRFYK